MDQKITLASSIVSAERVVRSPVERILELKRLAEFPLSGDSPRGGLPGTVISGLRRAVGSPLEEYRDESIQYFFREMIQDAARGPAPDKSLPGLVYLAPFDVLSHNGGAARVLGLAESLGEAFRVTVISLVSSGRQPEVLPLTRNVRILFAPVTREFEEQVAANRKVYGGASFSLTLAEKWEGLNIARYWLESYMKESRVLLLNQPYLIKMAEASRDKERTVLVYDVPEVNSFFTLRFAGPDADQDKVRECQAALEKGTCTAANVIAMCSKVDSGRLIEEQGTSIEDRLAIVPNGVWIDRGTYLPASKSRLLNERCGIDSFLTAFLGSPGYDPNLDAAEFMIEVLAPAHTDHKFIIVGMSEADRKKSGPVPGNVHFMGRVDELRKATILAMSDLALAPMHYDSGSSLKIPDYISHGTPVIATNHGLRGFEALTELAVMSERSDFLEAYSEFSSRIIKDPEYVESQVSEMADVIRERYDWSVIGNAYAERILQSI